MIPEETGCFALIYSNISSITFFFGLTMKRRLGRLKLCVNLKLIESKESISVKKTACLWSTGTLTSSWVTCVEGAV